MNKFHFPPIVFAENLIVETGHVLSLQLNFFIFHFSPSSLSFFLAQLSKG